MHIVPEAAILEVNLGPISIHVVPEADTLAVNLGLISISKSPCSFHVIKHMEKCVEVGCDKAQVKTC
jgi:hypothetical protein